MVTGEQFTFQCHRLPPRDKRAVAGRDVIGRAEAALLRPDSVTRAEPTRRALALLLFAFSSAGMTSAWLEVTSGCAVTSAGDWLVLLRASLLLVRLLMAVPDVGTALPEDRLQAQKMGIILNC